MTPNDVSTASTNLLLIGAIICALPWNRLRTLTVRLKEGTVHLVFTKAS